MRKVEWESVDEQGSGDFKRLLPGGYVVKFTNVEDDEAHERAYLVFDIAEGDNAGFYAADSFYDGKDYAHRIMLSYKSGALGFLKHKLSIVSASNPGFDAESAWNGGKLTVFAGKRVGLVVGDEEYTANTGEVRTRLDWFHSTMVTPDDVHAGKFEIPKTKRLNPDATESASADTSVYQDDSDVPF